LTGRIVFTLTPGKQTFARSRLENENFNLNRLLPGSLAIQTEKW
jgi:hypothetical protein